MGLHHRILLVSLLLLHQQRLSFGDPGRLFSYRPRFTQQQFRPYRNTDLTEIIDQTELIDQTNVIQPDSNGRAFLPPIPPRPASGSYPAIKFTIYSYQPTANVLQQS